MIEIKYVYHTGILLPSKSFLKITIWAIIIAETSRISHTANAKYLDMLLLMKENMPCTAISDL